MGITPADTPILLDLTRLTRRAGRRLTGVDRVEKAYLEAFLDAPLFFGLVQTSIGYILLDCEGCKAFHEHLTANAWGPKRGLAYLSRRMDPERARAESDLRAIARARCLPIGLARMLRRHLPSGTVIFNTGHTNLNQRVIDAYRAIPDARLAVFIHDTIPIDHPNWQRPGTVNRFAGFLRRATASADLLICNSRVTLNALLQTGHALSGQTCVAHLGVDVPDPAPPPLGDWTGKPYFVCLGTIEPRKNHELLLDLWGDVPDAHLLICGARGWRNETVFARLDAHPPRVHELSGLSDDEIAGLLKGSAGLLFPSRAEGYGLPPIEAAALGVPVLCADLPVYREVLGDIPVYASVDNAYLWKQKINDLLGVYRAGGPEARQSTERFIPPTWDTHIKTVLTRL